MADVIVLFREQRTFSFHAINKCISHNGADAAPLAWE